MNNTIRRKAIIQAIATLKMEDMHVKPEYLKNYCLKHNLSIRNEPTLVLKKGDSYGKRNI